MEQRMGLCVPNGCTDEDIANNYNALYADLGTIIRVANCATADSHEEKTTIGTDGMIFM